MFLCRKDVQQKMRPENIEMTIRCQFACKESKVIGSYGCSFVGSFKGHTVIPKSVSAEPIFPKKNSGLLILPPFGCLVNETESLSLYGFNERI